MTRGAFLGLMALALLAGLALRLPGLGDRPLHHDEANQAVKFGALVEHGEYDYDPTDHHGPTLYYLTLPSAWLRGQFTLASLDVVTVRLVPVAFGAALILMCGAFAPVLGRTAGASAAGLVAVSPAFVYYSRFYIQETMFVGFSVGFLLLLGRLIVSPGLGMAVGAGAFAGLAFATKETSVITIGAAVVAALIASFEGRAGSARHHTRAIAHVSAAIAVAVAVAFAFYSAWFTHPERFVNAILAFDTYVGRGLGDTAHVQPWSYYLGLLAWSSAGGLRWTEALVLAWAAIGLVVAARGGGFWPRFIGVYAVLTTAVFSWMAYKTPWNLLPFYAGVILVAGIGIQAAFTQVKRRALRLAVGVVLLVGMTHLSVQAVRASTRYGVDPRNPYVYAHTTPDFLRLVKRIDDLAALRSEGTHTLIAVVAGPYEQWPLPWYLRRFDRVGYWTDAGSVGQAGAAPIVVASADQAPAMDARLGDRYVSEYYGLRPEVLLTLFVDRALWERFLATRSEARTDQR